MVKKNITSIIIIGIVSLLILSFIFNVGGIRFAIIGEEKGWLIYDEVCNTDSECKDYFISEGATEKILNEIPYRCEDNFCQMYIVDRGIRAE